MIGDAEFCIYFLRGKGGKKSVCVRYDCLVGGAWGSDIAMCGVAESIRGFVTAFSIVINVF